MGVININRYRRNLSRFTSKWPNHWVRKDDFGGFWRWKLKAETRDRCVLDRSHRKEAYYRLCKILPRWKAYRGASRGVRWRETLEESLRRMSNAYDQIRSHSLLEFSDVSNGLLRLIWDELGRVKESDGKTNTRGSYYIVAVSKPLMLLWGQTPAFDINVRRNFLEDFVMYPKYRFGNVWSFEDWRRVMKIFQEDLERNPEVVDYFREESLRIFGTDSVVPYGRFLDIHYYF